MPVLSRPYGPKRLQQSPMALVEPGKLYLLWGLAHESKADS